MPIQPQGDANFTPTQGTFRDLKPFRFWCQKVLPLVYDDSLSYYELLCKVVDYLNMTMEDVETLHDDVDNLHTAYVQLQTYVNNYFHTLDVSQEINDKLDEMATDGTLTALISPLLPDLIGDWLEENLSPTTPPIDRTLTIANAGADAKIVGDKISQFVNSTFCVMFDFYIESLEKDTTNNIAYVKFAGTNAHFRGGQSFNFNFATAESEYIVHETPNGDTGNFMKIPYNNTLCIDRSNSTLFVTTANNMTRPTLNYIPLYYVSNAGEITPTIVTGFMFNKVAYNNSALNEFTEWTDRISTEEPEADGVNTVYLPLSGTNVHFRGGHDFNIDLTESKHSSFFTTESPNGLTNCLILHRDRTLCYDLDRTVFVEFAGNHRLGLNQFVVPLFYCTNDDKVVPTITTEYAYNLRKTDIQNTRNNAISTNVKNVNLNQYTVLVDDAFQGVEKGSDGTNYISLTGPNLHFRGGHRFNISLSEEAYPDFYTDVSPNGLSNCLILHRDRTVCYNLPTQELLDVQGNYNIPTDEYLIPLFYCDNGDNIVPTITTEYMYNKYYYSKNPIENFPTYFESMIETRLSQFRDVVLTMENPDMFIFITDRHIESNRNYSAGIIKYISSITGITTVFDGGDYYDHDISKNNALKKLGEALGCFADCKNYFPMIGNHDINTNTIGENYYIPYLTVNNIITNGLDGNVVFFGGTIAERNYLFKKGRTVYVVFQAHTNGAISEGDVTDLVTKLSTMDYDRCYIFAHMFYSSGTTANLNQQRVIAGISTIADKEFVLITGHTHLDNNTYTDGIPIVSTTCDSYKARRSEVGTVNEIAFDIYAIDDNTINTIRIGAGNNRVIPVHQV